MEEIFCSYYDEEMEHDVPLQPNLTEAISFFKNFVWENNNKDSTMKMLIFKRHEDMTHLYLSHL
ncbi:MAG: hypothetical protein ACI978_001998 [Oleispira sp.]|jgi:hypothetical protein